MTITTLKRYVRVAVLGLSALLAACDGSGDGDGGGESEESVSLTVTSPSLMAGQTTQASVRDALGLVVEPRSLTWSSSDPAVATVTSDGFVATRNPGVATISVEEASVAVHGEVAVAVTAPPDAVSSLAIEVSPLLMPESMGGFAVMVDGIPTTQSVSLQIAPSLLESVELVRIGSSARFLAVLPGVPYDVRSYERDCPSGECFIGIVTIVDADPSRTHNRLVTAPFLPSNAPAVNVTVEASDIQSSDYVVNIRNDRLRQDDNTAEVVQTFYDHFGDDYEYLTTVQAADDGFTPYFVSYRNRISGTGVGTYDLTTELGARPDGALFGIVNWGHFGFDLGASVVSHEMGHAFMSFLRATPLGVNSPHWPISSTAVGIMGDGRPKSDMKLTALGDERYRVDAQSPEGGFNDLELYLFGLADPSEVGDQVVFDDQRQTLEIGSVLHGPVTHVTIDDVIHAYGPRTPTWTGSPVTFRMATIVVSRGRLLTSREMAYCDHMARQGEAMEASLLADGRYRTPFYVTTRGRGTLVTRLQ